MNEETFLEFASSNPARVAPPKDEAQNDKNMFYVDG